MDAPRRLRPPVQPPKPPCALRLFGAAAATAVPPAPAAPSCPHVRRGESSALPRSVTFADGAASQPGLPVARRSGRGLALLAAAWAARQEAPVQGAPEPLARSRAAPLRRAAGLPGNASGKASVAALRRELKVRGLLSAHGAWPLAPTLAVLLAQPFSVVDAHAALQHQAWERAFAAQQGRSPRKADGAAGLIPASILEMYRQYRRLRGEALSPRSVANGLSSDRSLAGSPSASEEPRARPRRRLALEAAAAVGPAVRFRGRSSP